MGGVCSKATAVDKSPSESAVNATTYEPRSKLQSNRDIIVEREKYEQKEEQMPQQASLVFAVNGANDEVSGPQMRPSLSQEAKPKPMASSKVSEVSSLLGRAGNVGIGKAVEVLDTLGSSMTSLQYNAGFVSVATTKGNKINILAFEVANTIVKGANLMVSLSKENMNHLKEVVLPSEGVQHLISKDTDELLKMAAADKREELKIFTGEVVRFGNRCKDLQWHNLDRYFEKLGSELTPESELKEKAEKMMQNLLTMVQCTAELYHELHALDRIELDYKRKLQEEEVTTAVQRVDTLQNIRQQLKSRKKHVKILKKKSLWSKILEEVMEKLVDFVHFLHSEIHSAFGSADGAKPVRSNTLQRLGPAGLALHYANIITQIDTLVSGPGSVPPNTRDSLYQALPPRMKSAFRAKLQSFEIKKELTASQMKREMERTLGWLVPLATNTAKAHHGFGWVGEWANTGRQSDMIRIETLHHAVKEKTEPYMVDLLMRLHHLISLTKSNNGGIKSPVRSPTQNSSKSILTKEDEEMLGSWKQTPGISKSQEFCTVKCKSSNHCVRDDHRKEQFAIRRQCTFPFIDFDVGRIRALDVIDGLDTQ